MSKPEGTSQNQEQIKSTMECKITHSSHSHGLTLEHIQMPYYCSGCKEIGFGSCYQCKSSDQCNFYLHIECATAHDFEVSHPFSDSCQFTFLEEGSSSKSLCYVCGRKVKGFRYKCSCTFIKRNLHPRCAKYEDKYELNGWTLKISKKIPSKCLHCEAKDVVKGWAYVSSCGDYCFHYACLGEKFYEEWTKGSFSGLTDMSEMIGLSVVKLVSKQVQVQRRKKTSKRNASNGNVISFAANVTSAVVNG